MVVCMEAAAALMVSVSRRRATSLLNSRSHRTELAVAAQIIQSSAPSGTVQKAALQERQLDQPAPCLSFRHDFCLSRTAGLKEPLQHGGVDGSADRSGGPRRRGILGREHCVENCLLHGLDGG